MKLPRILHKSWEINAFKMTTHKLNYNKLNCIKKYF